ncbi:MAG: hypothetical protein WBC91_13510 [Phototrophicaceae bacterium]
MKMIWLFIVCVIFTVPVIAQDVDLTLYEFDTGTTLTYPADWQDELTDGVLALSTNSPTQVLVLDYPLVNTLAEDGETVTLRNAVSALTTLLLDEQIDPLEIYEFSLEGRTIAAYDIDLTLSGAVYGVEFSNGAIGLLVTIELDQETETNLLMSFNNTQDIVSDVTLPTGRNNQVRDEPSVFLLPTNQRFFVPSGWDLDLRQRDDLQYAVVSLPDADLRVQLIDLSEVVPKGTDLDAVINGDTYDWTEAFGVEVISTSVTYHLGDREAVNYDVRVDNTDASLIILRFSDDAIGVVVIIGEDRDAYETTIHQLIGSFNNLGAVLNFLQ